MDDAILRAAAAKPTRVVATGGTGSGRFDALVVEDVHVINDWADYDQGDDEALFENGRLVQPPEAPKTK